ncbi:hypothetical protein O8B93_27440 [Agrobacterium rhizogenes]|uniref:hypothetical protein n=1 Tax=Rhizobium rhizogenes TaxID=359 RepID=UPI0022B6F2B4|nr:hypothetical protein [Rhizobium rhizogenes]MCZ7451300.1 hypothetical protein [Rhizobium rhizogenes]
MKHIVDTSLRQMKPENSPTFIGTTAISVNAATRDALEHAHTELLGITNYLEALYAQIQRAAHGGHGLSIVTDGRRASDGESFS